MDSLNEIYRRRTQQFAVRLVSFVDAMPRTTSSFVIAKQLIRSGSSVAANYRAMCLARSAAERFAKLCIVVEEADETQMWLELVSETRLIAQAQTEPLLVKAYEFAKTFTAYRAKLRPPGHDS